MEAERETPTKMRWRVMRNQAGEFNKPIYAGINKHGNGFELTFRKMKTSFECAYPNGLIVQKDMVTGVWFDLGV